MLPARPIGYYVGPAEGALYIWLSPDTTSINLLPMSRLFAPPTPLEQLTTSPRPAIPGPVLATTPPETGGGEADRPPPPARGSNPSGPSPAAAPVTPVPESSAYGLLGLAVAAAFGVRSVNGRSI